MEKGKWSSTEDLCNPACRVIDKFGDKWSLLILIKLERNGVMRFNELLKSIPNISQRMLTITLRSLEALGLVSREIFPEIPPKVEYRLTDLGRELMPYINQLIDWIKMNLPNLDEEVLVK
jgi:DNA-binding HxlR family transcriptional regulator